MQPAFLPSCAEIRRLLEALGNQGMRKLSALSGVPFSTLYKIANGETPNPGVETVRRFYSQAQTLAQEASHAS